MPLVTAIDLFRSANKLLTEQNRRYLASGKNNADFFSDPIESQIRTVINDMRKTGESILKLARVKAGDNGETQH